MCAPLIAEPLPQGMSFIGYSENGWEAYIVDSSGEPVPFEQVKNPREFTWHQLTKRYAFVSASGEVYLGKGNASKKIASVSDKDAFAQIKLVDDGTRLIAIRLIGKKSEMTALASWRADKHQFIDFHSQYGKIFDPIHVENIDYFTVVSCMLQCGGITQELWFKDSRGVAKQATLHNGIVRYPYKSKSSDSVFYSLNQEGQYNIWKLENGQSRQLTYGQGSDVSPVMDAKGNLFFIKKSKRGSLLYKMTKEGEVEVKVKGVSEIRNLELNQ